MAISAIGGGRSGPLFRYVAKAARHAAQVLPVIGAIRADGVTSLLGIAAELNRRGILTALGGQWYATTVRNLLGRFGSLTRLATGTGDRGGTPSYQNRMVYGG